MPSTCGLVTQKKRAEPKARVTQDVDDAFEALLQVRPDLSLKMESDLEEVLRIAELIKSELDVASGISDRLK